MVQRIHDSSEGLSGKQDASQPQKARFYFLFKPNNEHSAELGVCSLYRRQKRRHARNNISASSITTHTHFPAALLAQFYCRFAVYAKVRFMYMLILSVALSKLRIVAMFLNVACCVVTFLFDPRTKLQISTYRLISYSSYTEN
jgi:hypothetical protein